jgi:hypothetical protein
MLSYGARARQGRAALSTVAPPIGPPRHPAQVALAPGVQLEASICYTQVGLDSLAL